MLRKLKFFLSGYFILFVSVVNGQFTSHSPYSKFGIGDILQTGFAHNKAMGGIGIGLRAKNRINYLNPASYSSQDTMSFIFDVGLSGIYSVLETAEINENTRDINVNHIAIGFPFFKFWKSSIGIVPFSKVNYDLILEENSEEITENYNIQYKGKGGINQFYFGNSFLIGNHIALGINISYLFGIIERSKTIKISDYTYQAFSNFSDKVDIGDFYLDYGLQFFTDINEKNRLTLGLTFVNKSDINAKFDSLTVRNFEPFRIDTFKFSNYSDKTIVLPRKVGIGLTYKFDNKLLLGFDYISENWEKAIFPGQGDTLANSSSFRFGLEYTAMPSTKSRRSKYWQRINFRLGGHYTKSFLLIEGNQINDYGFSVGLGLPLKNEKKLFTNTSFSLTYELGQRGTLDNGLIKETYHFFSIGLTLYDFWFFKPKYD
jgi:hypothetical protein